MKVSLSSFVSTRNLSRNLAGLLCAIDSTKRDHLSLNSSTNGIPSLESFVPQRQNVGKLFLTGATLGPVVDSLHNQCLLEYDRAPINMFLLTSQANPEEHHYLFSSSFFIPPLLGIAYVVLGGILPRIFEYLVPSSSARVDSKETLRGKAIFAVLSTALIIRLSEFLQTQQTLSGEDATFFFLNLNNIVMNIAAFLQWAILDRTLPALLAATLTSVGGPLSELPFVANGFWHYIPSASDYFPLENTFLSKTYDINLALSSITGPCYFAVTMDAIALGRWFDAQDSNDETLDQ